MGRTHPRKVVAMLACCVSGSVVLAGEASAEQIFQERYHDEATAVNENFCGAAGLTTRHDFVVDGKVRAVQRGPNGLAYVLDNLNETEVITNLDNGKTVTAVLQYHQKDLKLADNGDGTLTGVGLSTGSTVLYGADGKPFARTTGQSRFEHLIDHGGTPTDPFDDELIDMESVKRAGRSDDLCAAFVQAIT